jgi:hypothetical protein
MHETDASDGWSWFNSARPDNTRDEALTRAAGACFAGPDGDLLLRHLRSVFVDRRVPPDASDSMLRHVEGQRYAIDYLTRLARTRG